MSKPQLIIIRLTKHCNLSKDKNKTVKEDALTKFPLIQDCELKEDQINFNCLL